MASKLLVMTLQRRTRLSRIKSLTHGSYLPQTQSVRKSGFIPPSQYDTKFPDKLKIGNVFRNNWEIIPLFLVTMTSMGILFFSVFWAIKNKVDVVFATHSRDNISRTMNLRNPESHKLIHIKQEYKPWPEMQDSLDKMRQQENKMRRMKDKVKSACPPS